MINNCNLFYCLLLSSIIFLFAQIVEPNCVNSVLDDACRLQLWQWEAACNYFSILWTFCNQFMLQILHHLLYTKNDHIVIFFDVELPEIATEEPRLLGDTVSQCGQAGVVD